MFVPYLDNVSLTFSFSGLIWAIWKSKTFSTLVRRHAKHNIEEEKISYNIDVAKFILPPKQNKSITVWTQIILVIVLVPRPAKINNEWSLRHCYPWRDSGEKPLFTHLASIKNPVTSILFGICSYSLQITIIEKKMKTSLISTYWIMQTLLCKYKNNISQTDYIIIKIDL